MAVMVERQKRYCPNCHELISYTLVDVKIREKNSKTTYQENGKEYTMIRSDVAWYVTCPTCKNYFNVENYTRYTKPGEYYHRLPGTQNK